jgi:hypothetical protein
MASAEAAPVGDHQVQTDSPPYPAIWKLLRAGRVIPFLGAGASLVGRPVGGIWNPNQPEFLPLAKELADHIASFCNYQTHDPRDRENLAMVASYCAVMLGRDDLRELLHSVLQGGYQPSNLHHLLASIPPVPRPDAGPPTACDGANLLIITTNYDTLIEDAFRAAKKPFDVVIYPTDCPEALGSVQYWEDAGNPEDIGRASFVDPKTLTPDLSRRSVILKIHGHLHSQEASKDSFVITEEDYVTFLSRMNSQTAVPPWFEQQFQSRRFLFLGYRLNDWNMRVLVSNRLQLASNSWAIQRDLTWPEYRLWNKRGVVIFRQDLQLFADRMWEVGRGAAGAAGGA